MRRLTTFFRLLHIQIVLARYGVDRIVLSTPWFASFRFLIYVNPFYWFNSNKTKLKDGERLRKAFEELGPIFVKFGQMLSTRRDFLPDEIANELALLQDHVPPFPSKIAREILEQTYGAKIEAIFASFQDEPLASASIAQVHCATLFEGHDVIVKVLRPGVKRLIQRDIALLYSVARITEFLWRDSRRLRPREVVAEFERSLIDELDLVREAANAAQLRRNFTDSPLLYVPEVHWSYVKQNVLVMERIYGIRISDIDQLKAINIDFKLLAERGVEIFFTQVFRDCFFHADMHPGNIFVNPNNPRDPQYLGVDFGIIGTLNPSDQRYLAENFLAFFKRDYRKVAELHVESGWVPFDTRVDEFESAIRTVCEPVFQRPLKEISCGMILLRLFQTARRFNMEVQPQLVLLQKTLLNVEGLGRQLYPDLDLWSTAKPFLERWIKKQIGLRATFRKIIDRAPFWSEKMPEIPDLIYNALIYVNDQRLHQQVQRSKKGESERTSSRALRHGFLLGIAVALVVGVLIRII